jgi:hypothetical protein
MGTSDKLFVHLSSENHCVCQKTGSSVLNTLQPKSMVKYRRGHGLGLLRIVRLPSNKNGTLPCPFLFFNYPGTRLPEDPQKFIKAIKWLANEARQNGSVDTLARNFF